MLAMHLPKPGNSGMPGDVPRVPWSARRHPRNAATRLGGGFRRSVSKSMYKKTAPLTLQRFRLNLLEGGPVKRRTEAAFFSTRTLFDLSGRVNKVFACQFAWTFRHLRGRSGPARAGNRCRSGADGRETGSPPTARSCDAPRRDPIRTLRPNFRWEAAQSSRRRISWTNSPRVFSSDWKSPSMALEMAYVFCF